MSRKIPKPHFTNHRRLLGSWKAFCNCWGKWKISFLTTLPFFSHTFSLLLFFPELEEWLCFFSSPPPSSSLPCSTFKQPYPYGRTDKSSTTPPPHKLQNSSHSWVLWFGAAETGNTFQLNPKQCSHDPLGTGLWGAQVQTVTLLHRLFQDENRIKNKYRHMSRISGPIIWCFSVSVVHPYLTECLALSGSTVFL